MIVFGDTFRDIFHTLKLSLIHLGLILCVICYIVFGAFVLHKIEGKEEVQQIHANNFRRNKTLSDLRASTFGLISIALTHGNDENQFKSLLSTLIKDFLTVNDNIGNMADEVEIIMDPSASFINTLPYTKLVHWDFASATLFSFSAITTIGYGNTAPSTTLGRLFCIIYSLIGIPLAMMAIADLGKFIFEGAKHLLNYLLDLIKKKAKDGKKKSHDPEDSHGWSLLIGFILYILLGAGLLPLWEELKFFDAVYYCFITLTTIGLGDIFPSNLSFLPLTLLYISVGLALTTMSIEAAGNSFRKLHYLGAKLKNVKSSVVWFGGKNLTVEEVLQAVGKKYGIPQDEITQLDLDSVINGAITEKIEIKAAAKREKQQETRTLRDLIQKQMLESPMPLLAFQKQIVAQQEEKSQQQDLNANKSSTNDIKYELLKPPLTPLMVSPAVSLKRQLSKTPSESNSPPLSLRYADEAALSSIESLSVKDRSRQSIDSEHEAGLAFVQNPCPNFARISEILRNQILFSERTEEIYTPLYCTSEFNPEAIIPRQAIVHNVADPQLVRSQPIPLVSALIESEKEVSYSEIPSRSGSLTPTKAAGVFNRARLGSHPSQERVFISSKRTLSQSLGLKVPTDNELKRLTSRKKSKVSISMVTSAYQPFYLIRVSDLRTHKMPSERCKQCLVAFPNMKGVSATLVLIHWERCKQRRSISEPGEGLKYRPVVVHPWFTCVSRRFPYFSIDLLKIAKNTLECIDSKQQQLLYQQLGIEDIDDITVDEHCNWHEYPDTYQGCYV